MSTSTPWRQAVIASIHDAAVLIGLLALVDGTGEVIEAAQRNHRARLPNRYAPSAT